MNIIILGAGQVGFRLARQLILEGKQVTLIEKDPQKAKHATEHLDCLVMNEEGNNIETLRRAGIEKADFFVSVTESDEINMIACGLVASEPRHPVTIARVRNLDYSKSRMANNPLFGIDHLINPEIETAKVIVRAASSGALGNIMLFETADLQMRTVSVKRESPLNGRSLQELKIQMGEDFLIPIVVRNDEHLIPTGSTQIKEGDILYILGEEKLFTDMLETSGSINKKMKRIAIVGGGKIGRYVADYLQKNELPQIRRILQKLIRKNPRTVHFIDQDYDRCKMLCERYPEAMVTHADVSDESFWEEETLSNHDLLITTTSNQELNIITAMYAKKTGTPRVINLVQRVGYETISQDLGIDVTVSQNSTMVNSILKYIRRGNIHSVHTISGTQLEIIEFTIEKGSPILMTPIRNVKLPKNTLLILMVRNGETHIPHGDMVLEAGDNVVTVTRNDSIKKLEQLFVGS